MKAKPITRSVILAAPTHSRGTILSNLRELSPGNIGERGIRLLGVSMSQLTEESAIQLTLDGHGTNEREEAITSTVVKIKERFGTYSIAPASLVDGGKLRNDEENPLKWGPSSSASGR